MSGTLYVFASTRRIERPSASAQEDDRLASRTSAAKAAGESTDDRQFGPEVGQ